jgi:hypothetical protein
MAEKCGTQAERIISRDRCYDFIAQTAASFCEHLAITSVFEENAIFTPKIGKNRKKF